MTTPFITVAADVLSSWLDRHPVDATFAGDHARDHLLDDPSPEVAAARTDELRVQLAAIDAAEPASIDEQIDAAVLRTTLRAELLDLEGLDESGWDAMIHNPGSALYGLASRPFAPAATRLESARARLAAVPAYLAAARNRLTALSRPHAETAIKQLDGTVGLIDDTLPGLAEEADGALGPEAMAARDAVVEHQDWLRSRLADATRDPRIGRDAFRAKLALALDTEFEPDALLARAESDLDRVSAEIATEAGRFAGVAEPDAGAVAGVLAELGADVATDDTVLDRCRDALHHATMFVRDARLMTVYDDPIDIIEMPEIDRGVAGAYCNPSGPLEQQPLPTQFAVSPTPDGWPQERIDSYYREYNVHMLHDLTVHEAMPGHALQLMHSNRNPASTPVRALFGSGSFIEGWAVYAEELMATHGFRRNESARLASALRMQQLKMQLRTILNTVLDIRFHCHGLDQASAMTLMTERGFQEEGEAIEKWQRVQLSSTQLCTYYVGYSEVRDLAGDLRTAYADWTDQQLNDAILGHGSPPVRHLRTLLLN